MVLMFLLAQVLKNNSIVDIGWGIGFVLVATYTFFTQQVEFPTRPSLALLMTWAWGIRLAWHIGARNWGRGEDPRYAKWREEWGKTVVWRSFLQVFMLQGIIMWVVSLPIQFVVAEQTPPPSSLDWLTIPGVAIWLIGFLFEAIGDLQLMLFIQKPQPKPRFLTTGLWALTRHPNYFGEALLWWGFFLVALGSENGIFTIVSPLIIGFLLLKVSGIPMLEAPYKGNAEFDAYKRRTSAFFPWFPKKDVQ